MRVVAISGSLRARSSNASLLRAAAAVAPPGMEVVFYEALAQLPPFNPDLDGEGAVAAAPVAAWRGLLAAADGVILSSPEYAHGVPGALKNALDWVVSSGELVDKPLVLYNASPSGGAYAQRSLVETLTVMSAQVLTDASRLEPFVKRKADLDGEVIDAELRATLKSSLQVLARAIRSRLT